MCGAGNTGCSTERTRPAVASDAMRPSALEELRAEAEELSRALAATLGCSPLRAVADRLVDLLEGVVCAVDNGQSPAQLRTAIAAARGTASMLPGTFGRRFHLDAAVISTVLGEWAEAGARISPFMIPRYTAGWGYYRVIMPSEDQERAQTVRVVTFPGADRLSDVDLSDYPWLIHELAHDAFYRPTHHFRATFSTQLQTRLQQLKLRAAADTGSAAQQAARHVETIARHWTPRPDQRDWAHEIATDVVALWSLGPAFLMRFTRLLVDQPTSAWSAADQHPPHVTRAEALVLAAERLGWTEEAWALGEEVRLLREQPGLVTDALVYADSDLLRAAVDASLDACRVLSIPAMKPERFAVIRSACHSRSAALTGIDLIAAGAIARASLNAADYATWLDEVIARSS